MPGDNIVMSDEGKSSSREELERRLYGFLTEPELVELMLNAGGTVWAKRLGKEMTSIGTMASASAESVIGSVASTLLSTVTRGKPSLECELPPEASFDGSRFDALVPAVVAAPVFTIRRKASAVFTLQAYERQGIMSCEHRAAIESAVAQGHNILVVGGSVAPSTYNVAIRFAPSPMAMWGHHTICSKSYAKQFWGRKTVRTQD